MQHYRKSSHTVYDIKYHIVWITKYRKPVLSGEIAKRFRDLVREICRSNGVEILKGHVSKDYVHLFVSVLPHISVSALVRRIKGKSSRKVMMEFKAFSRTFWGRGYFVATSGNVTDEVTMKYIEQQDQESPDSDFKIDAE